MESDILLREETEADYYESECITRDAFWNSLFPGTDQHYFVHQIRKSPDYLPELSRVATTKDNKLILGCIYYSKASVYTVEGEKKDVITFGPVAVRPEYQRKGIGKKMIQETMKLATQKGYNAIIINCIENYYEKFGFKPCALFDIVNADSTLAPSFLCCELQPNALKDIKGKFKYTSSFDSINQVQLDEFDKKYPFKAKSLLSTDQVFLP